MNTMKALVKAKPEKGLWLEDVSIPEVGINDVLIKIQKTAICGTDVHIYNWDEWAQKTIRCPCPWVTSSQAAWLRSAATCTTSSGTWSPARATWYAAAAATAGGPPAPLPAHQRGGREPARRLRGISLHSGRQRLVLRSQHPQRRDFLLRSARNATHTALSFDVLARTCSSPAPAPSGAWRPPSCGTPGRGISS